MRLAALPVTVVVIAAWSGDARAQGDVGTAQVLFDEGRSLALVGKWDEACPRFEESQRLSPGVGTLFNLADCWEHVGRAASAWAAFLQVETETRAKGQAERARAARERARAIEERLGRLAVDVPPESAIDGLVVLRDGQPVRGTLFGVALPADAGDHVFEARAPGRVAWSTRVHVEDARTSRVRVPVLEIAPTTPEAPGPARPPPGAETAALRPLVPRVETRPEAEDPGKTARALGWVALGTGAGLGVLAVAAVAARESAVSKYNADPSCPPLDAPTRSQGCEDRVGEATTWRTVAIVSAGVGALAVGAGVVLHLTAPARPPPRSACAPGLLGVSCAWRF